MAKKSAVEKNKRREKLVKKYAEKRAALKAMAKDESLSLEERYNARLAVEVELVKDEGLTRSLVKAEAERSVTLAEDASVHERDVEARVKRSERSARASRAGEVGSG